MSDYTGPDHTVTVTTHAYQTRNIDDNSLTDVVEIDYDIDHPADCDALKYGEQCALDHEINANGWDYSGIPAEPGVYTVSCWSWGPDHNGEYDAGLHVSVHAEPTVETAVKS